MENTVFLVGAGPGDPGLLTVKGNNCLQIANVVVYDRLMDDSLLDLVPSDCERIFVGKSRGRQAFTQDEINQILIDRGRENRIVVRLKGGDPFVFGRGGEEAIALRTAGINFEIVPGITSSIAAAAYAGIPVTHRGIATNFTVISGSEDPTKPTSMVPWDVLAKTQGTLVVLMGWASLPKIIEVLVENGRKADTPISLVQWGTWTKQKTVTGILTDIVDKARNENLGSPVVAVIGDVVNLRPDIQWFDSKPLFGTRVLVTRSRTQSSKLKSLLFELGAEVIELPMIEITKLEDYEQLDTELKSVQSFSWLFFTSVNSVEAVFERLHELGKDARHLAHVKIMAIGDATRDKLLSKGIVADFMPSKSSSEEVVKELHSFDWKDAKVLIPASNIARTVIKGGLIEFGAEVVQINAYKNQTPEDISHLAVKILKEGVDVITFASSSTVDNLVDILDADKDLIDQSFNVSIGPTTSKTANKRGVKISVQAEMPTVESMVDSLLSHYND